jgi:hypothetical protein
MFGENAGTGVEKPVRRSLCSRCGGGLEFALKLPKSLDQPAFEIFRCVSCGLFDWIAQQES